MPELAPLRSRGRPRAPKTGRPHRSRAEMERFLEACLQADIQGLTAREAVAKLASQGFERVDEARYSNALRDARHRAPARLRRIAEHAPEFHADAIANVRAVRSELWRQYYGIRSAPRPDQPGGEDLTPVERVRWDALAAQARARILKEIRDTEPTLTAYIEAAVVRDRLAAAEAEEAPWRAALPEGRVDGGGGVAPSPPAAAAANDDPDAGWTLAPNPEAPGSLMAIPVQGAPSS